MPEIQDTNVSNAWRRAATMAASAPRREVCNLVVNITGLDAGEALEDERLRSVLDSKLAANGDFSVSTVASTIFPQSLWRKDETRDKLYERYLRLWPRITACQQNKRGTYFQRMIGYPRLGEPTLNQLEHVIGAYAKGIRRRSTLQCAILNPGLDLNATPYQGFPCMQQLSFHPEGKGGLRISALYPMHYLWARAYGNYIGVLNLGRFMAFAMGLRLTTVTCIALVAKLDQPKLAAAVEKEMVSE